LALMPLTCLILHIRYALYLHFFLYFYLLCTKQEQALSAIFPVFLFILVMAGVLAS